MAEVTGQGRNQSAADDPAALEEEARTQLARMIALHGYDPSLVEDDIFRRFVGILNPRFTVPSRGAIEEMCDGIFDDAWRDFISRNLQSFLNAPTYSLAVGRAKAMDKQFLYVARHFIDDEWKLHRVIVSALLESDVPCAGPILGVHVLRGNVNHVLFDPFMPNTVSVMVADSDIQAMLNRCIIQGGIIRGTELHAATFVDLVLHSVARCLVPDPSFAWELSEDLELEELQLTRQERQRLLSRLGPDYQWAYDDQEWYLCYCSLEAIQNSSKGSSSRSSRPFRELLWRLWGRMHRAIRAVSAPGRSTSNLCLAELFKLRDVLRSELDRADIYGEEASRYFFEDGKDVASLLGQALETLDKAIQDSCLIWSVPLVLDPRYKLRYINFCFERAYGASEAGKYISQVKTMIKKMCGIYVYHSDSTRVAANKDDDGPLEQAWNEYCCSQSQLDDGMANGEEAELARYLEDRLHPQSQEDFDALSWWKVHSREYPNVAQLARCALAMPTCSKLSSEQMAYVKSKIRGYSKREYKEYYDM